MLITDRYDGLKPKLAQCDGSRQHDAMSDIPANENRFRKFCFTLYGVQDVEEACLMLQDDFGCDVIVLLFCAWGGVSGIQFHTETPRQADHILQPWREAVIEPLREIRRHLASESRDIPWVETCTHIKKAELAAECASIDKLFSFRESLDKPHVQDTNRAGIIYTNIRHYADYLEQTLPEHSIDILVSASCRIAEKECFF
jgi:uncharacterized protein (TIGR02444 family)